MRGEKFPSETGGHALAVPMIELSGCPRIEQSHRSQEKMGTKESLNRNSNVTSR
jgi:hypothetical protein